VVLVVENLETIIDHVTIYRQGAKVTRYGKIELEEGQHTVAIELPEFIDPDSARVKGKGDGLIININLEENFRQETMREGVKELQDELEAVRKDLKFTQKRKGLLEQQKTQLSTMQDNFMSTFPKIYAAGESTVEKFMTFTTHHESQFTQVSADIRELGKKIEELTIRANILVQQLNQLGQQKEITRYYLLKVNINVRAAGEFQFYADYQSRSPFWTPVYDINLGDTAASVKIMANCINNTGEDWKDVELEVSTATMAAIRAEKPTPFIVTEFQYRPPPAPPGMARGAMAAAPMKKMARREASEEKEVMEEKVDMDEMGAMGGGFDGAAASVMNIPKAPAVREQRAQVSDAVGVQTFKLPGRVSIPSDKDPHPVTLTTTELPSRKKLFWSSARAHIVVAQDALTNGELVLLPGKVKVYHQDEFLGESSIPLITPNEEFSLGARASYDVKVEKKLVDRSKEKTLVKGKYIQNYAYEIQIKNLNQVEGLLKVYDRIPHSDSDKIKVLPEFLDRQPDKIRLGILKWKIELKDVDQLKITYKYAVEWDQSVTITPELP